MARPYPRGENEEATDRYYFSVDIILLNNGRMSDNLQDTLDAGVPEWVREQLEDSVVLYQP